MDARYRRRHQDGLKNRGGSIKVALIGCSIVERLSMSISSQVARRMSRDAGTAGSRLEREGEGLMPLSTKQRGAVLWVIQGLLAAVFLFAGGFKLALPLAALAKLSPLPAPFLKFIGVCEVTGAIGLILPGLLRIRTGLTPLAAAGLVVIMIGATIVTVATQGAAPAALPFCVGILAATVALGRRRLLEPARYVTVTARS
jgi:hypothetical protein